MTMIKPGMSVVVRAPGGTLYEVGRYFRQEAYVPGHVRAAGDVLKVTTVDSPF